MVKPIIDELAVLKESRLKGQTQKAEASPDTEVSNKSVAIRIPNIYSYEKKTVFLSGE
jgi:hypothetical protein